MKADEYSAYGAWIKEASDKNEWLAKEDILKFVNNNINPESVTHSQQHADTITSNSETDELHATDQSPKHKITFAP